MSLLLLLAGCDRVAALLPDLPVVGGVGGDGPEGFTCPAGATYAVVGPAEEAARDLDGTELHTCRDAEGRTAGPHLERWPDGGTACEGGWVDGERDGTWLTWHPDGAFRSQITWDRGRQDGPRREVGRDGRVVEILMQAGVASALVTLAPGAPMPEWEGGRRVEGTRYASHVGPR